MNTTIADLRYKELLIKFSENISCICSIKDSFRYIGSNELMLKVFSRYSLRTMFYIIKYCEAFEKIEKYLLQLESNGKSMKYRIENDIYFYLDSAIISFKAITEKNILKADKIYSPDLKKIFADKCCEWLEEIKDLDLGNIRNDIVHVNDYGLSLESWAIIDEDKTKMKLIYENWFTERITQEKINEILEKAIHFIDDFLGLIVSDIFYQLGKPEKAIFYYENESNSVDINDYSLIEEI